MMNTVLITKVKWNKLFLLLIFFGGTVMSSNIDPKTKKLIAATMQQKMDIAEKDIKYIEVRNENWPSSALGCAVIGQYYLPMITPGYRVKIEVEGKIYLLHTSATKAIICDNKLHKNKTGTKPPSLELTTKIKAIQLSRQYLLRNKPEDSKAVKLLRVVEKNWLEVKTSCTEEELFNKTNHGYLVVFKHLGNNRTFYSDGIKVVACKS